MGREGTHIGSIVPNLARVALDVAEPDCPPPVRVLSFQPVVLSVGQVVVLLAWKLGRVDGAGGPSTLVDEERDVLDHVKVADRLAI